MKIKNFGKFKDKTIFLNVSPGKEFVRLAHNLNNYFEYKNIPLSPYDAEEKVFHITLANGELSAQEMALL